MDKKLYNENVLTEAASLVREAVKARENAYAPYSNFLVGAALLTEEGAVYTGCNIENAAHSPGLCAERTAVAKAVSEGERRFKAIAVAGWRGLSEKAFDSGFVYPCGVCRQVLLEFCNPKKFDIIVAESLESFSVHTLAELIPHAFKEY